MKRFYASALPATLLWAATSVGCGDDQDEAKGRGSDGGARAAIDAAADAAPQVQDAGTKACDLAAPCKAVETSTIRFEGCCTADEACGLRAADPISIATFQASMSEELNQPGACVALDKLATKGPTDTEQLVDTPDGGTIYIATECETARLVSLPLRGCCLPSGRCGVSSYPVYSMLGLLVGDMTPGFTQLECVTSKEMNEQLQATALAGFGELPSTDAPCDYPALVARLQAP